jgi:hypothetical protein
MILLHLRLLLPFNKPTSTVLNSVLEMQKDASGSSPVHHGIGHRGREGGVSACVSALLQEWGRERQQDCHLSLKLRHLDVPWDSISLPPT